MEVFRDLYVSADADRMADVVEQIGRALPAGWARDRSAEANARGAIPFRPRPVYCFACTKEGGRPAAVLVLAQKDEGTFYVSNIVPTERHQLSHGEYNAILEHFHDRVFRPYADRAGLTIVLTGAEAGLENWLSGPAAEKLRLFSTSANKGTGSAHPNDRERWNDFVLSAHRDHSTLDPSTLQRWLTEVDGWSPEVAEQLALEYEYGRELLAFAEGRRSA
jgi:hypothetical protein